MLRFASLIDILCSAICIIDPDDKPFGTDLPVEVQNRILWMVRLAEHQDKITLVNKEIKTRKRCRLTDWLRVPKSYQRFHAPWKRICPCERCDPEPVCHWCLLYGKKNASVEFTVLETRLQRLRDGFGLYEDDKYHQFVRTNLPRFRDVLQFTASNILLPMLVHLPAGKYHFNYKRKVSPTASFASVSLGHVLFVEGMIAETGASQFRNPREVREQDRAMGIARFNLSLAKKKREQ